MPDADRHKVHKLAGTGGSMTALPICETQEGEVSAYIPTNLISITDGQIYLEPGLFFAGVRPAINVGISVSRVGYKAAVKAMKQVAASLRLDLAAYRELEAYTQLSVSVDAATQRQLDRGERLVKLLIQPQYQPMHEVDQVLAIYAATRGFLDDIRADDVPAFEARLLRAFREEHKGVRAALMAEPALDEQREAELRKIINDVKARTQTREAGRGADPRGRAGRG